MAGPAHIERFQNPGREPETRIKPIDSPTVFKPSYPKPPRPLSFEWFATGAKGYLEMNRERITAALANVKDGDIVLDDGCAIGLNLTIVADILEARGIRARLVGTDINDQDLQKGIAREDRVEFMHMDATDLKIIPNSVAVGFLLHAIHEIQGKSTRTINGVEQEVDNKDLAFQELFLAVKPGGNVVVASGFTAEVFNLPKELGYKSYREEVKKFNHLQQIAFSLLDEERDRGKKAFEQLPTKEYTEKMADAGFVNIATEQVYQPYEYEDMLLIGEDSGWLRGFFQTMTNAQSHNLEERWWAFKRALEIVRDEAIQKGEPPPKYPRMFAWITAEKPELPQTKAA